MIQDVELTIDCSALRPMNFHTPIAISPTTVQALRARKLLFIAFGLVALLMFSPAAKLLIYLIPPGTLWLGIHLLRRNKGIFVEFACWIFILIPFVRRVVDYKTGSVEVLMLTAPFVVLLCPMVSLLTRWTEVINKRTAPFGYAIAAVCFGTIVACAGLRFLDAAAVLPGWLLPLFWGLYIYVERRHFEDLYRGFERAMLAGTFVAGVYGVIQYFFLPKWDAEWMTTAKLVSLGKPEAMEVRVFSTMNSPQILAVFLLVGLVLAYVSKSRIKYPVLAAGFAALILSSARSSWVGFIGAIIFLAFRASFRERLRVIFVSVGCVVLLVALTKVPNLSESITARLDSLADPQHDLSAVDRAETYGRVLDLLISRPAGYGLGVDAGYSDAEHDSSILNIGFNLGFPGGLLFLFDLGIFSLVLLAARDKKNETRLLGLQASLVGLLLETPANNVVAGQTAFMLWSLLGLTYAMVSSSSDLRRVAVSQRPSAPGRLRPIPAALQAPATAMSARERP